MKSDPPRALWSAFHYSTDRGISWSQVDTNLQGALKSVHVGADVRQIVIGAAAGQVTLCTY
jgi:hypothetical protein